MDKELMDFIDQRLNKLPSKSKEKKLPWWWGVLGSIFAVLLASSSLAVSWGSTGTEVSHLKDETIKLNQGLEKNDQEHKEIRKTVNESSQVQATIKNEVVNIKEQFKEFKSIQEEILRLLLKGQNK